MFNGLGGLFGWCLIIAISGTILNYCVKLMNRKFGKKISASPLGKKIMKLLMTIFVRNHRYFGFTAVALLLIHFLIQFTTYGINVAGAMAALLLILQAGLGAYAIAKKKPRHGAWFIAHRTTAVLLILMIALHVIIPYSLNGILPKDNLAQVTETEAVTSSELPVFTMEELAEYNGEDGKSAYVAYQGTVYDITDHPKWAGGKHNGNTAGTDLTNVISKSPHGDAKFKTLEIVGTIK